MTRSANLNMPYLASGQSGGEVVHNDALNLIDCLVMPAVKSRATSAEPGSPSNGDAYLLPGSPTGTHWSGHGNQVAIYQNGWLFVAPKEGWNFWVKDEDAAIVYNGTTWIAAGGGDLSTAVIKSPLTANRNTVQITNRTTQGGLQLVDDDANAAHAGVPLLSMSDTNGNILQASWNASIGRWYFAFEDSGLVSVDLSFYNDGSINLYGGNFFNQSGDLVLATGKVNLGDRVYLRQPATIGSAPSFYLPNSIQAAYPLTTDASGNLSFAQVSPLCIQIQNTSTPGNVLRAAGSGVAWAGLGLNDLAGFGESSPSTGMFVRWDGDWGPGLIMASDLPQIPLSKIGAGDLTVEDLQTLRGTGGFFRAAGTTGALQFNNAGRFDAASNAIYDPAIGGLGLGISPGYLLHVSNPTYNAAPAEAVEQYEDSSPFKEFTGNEANDNTSPVSTAALANFTLARWLRISINGVVHWIPAYTSGIGP